MDSLRYTLPMTQAEALDILKTGQNVFLTGAAGSGKTYVLNQYINYLRKEGVEVAVTASTGIAATHLGGTTIHSWSGIGVRDRMTKSDLDALEEKSYLWKRFEHTRVLVIDEVSMLHHFRLDLVDTVCRAMRRRPEEPFGGLQVVLCGDFFQLPPVSRMGEPQAQFVHRSEAWTRMQLRVCYLEEQHRQDDEAFVRLLNNIRDTEVSEESYELLQSRFQKESTLKVRPTQLYTHNIDVDTINDAELAKLPGVVHEYRMTDSGKEHIVATLKKSCLAPERLRLKKGAQVMFVKNGFEQGYANGTLGTIIDFDMMGNPVVETAKGKRIAADKVDWKVAEENRVLASIEQLPLRLAWAITVHKSQGMSLDAVRVDLSKSFEPGMGYVALSRVRSLAGLTLLGLNDVALRVHPEVTELDVALRTDSSKSVKELQGFTAAEKRMLHEKFLELVRPKQKEKKIPTHHVTKKLLLEKKLLKEIAAARSLTVGTILDHIEQLLAEEETFDVQYLRTSSIPDTKFKKITDAFAAVAEKNPERRLAPIKILLGKGYTYDEIRLARLFLN